MSELSESKEQATMPGFNPFGADNKAALFQLSRGPAKGEYEGKPYHGTPLNMKEEDPENKKPRLRHKAHIRTFNLSDAADMETYEQVCQGIYDGGIMLSFEERVYEPKIQSWRVLMRWSEVYYDTPTALDKQK